MTVVDLINAFIQNGLWEVLRGVLVFLAMVGGGTLLKFGRVIKGKFLPGITQPKPKKGLILLVSNPDSAMFAIQYHFVQNKTLQHVWLIPSDSSQEATYGKSTLAIAQTIKQRCLDLAQAENRSFEVSIIEKGVAPGEAQETFDLVNRIFRNSGFTDKEMVADFTGGTKPMTVGMIMACLTSERELEYVSFNLQTKASHGPFVIDYRPSLFNLPDK